MHPRFDIWLVIGCFASKLHPRSDPTHIRHPFSTFITFSKAQTALRYGLCAISFSWCGKTRSGLAGASVVAAAAQGSLPNLPSPLGFPTLRRGCPEYRQGSALPSPHNLKARFRFWESTNVYECIKVVFRKAQIFFSFPDFGSTWIDAYRRWESGAAFNVPSRSTRPHEHEL